MNFILRCLGIILEIIFYGLIFSLVVFMCSCSSLQPEGGKAASLNQTKKELVDIIKDGDNLTPTQKVIIKHAIAELDDAKNQSAKIEKLQSQVIKTAEKAGAGKLIYYIMYFVVFLVGSFLIFKVLKKFSLF